MTIVLTSPGNGGLFDIIGRACHAIATLNTARGTTVPTEIEDFLEEWEGLTGADITLSYQSIIQSIASATSSWQGAGNALTSAIRSACENLLIEMVDDDTPQPSRNLTRALEYLIDQMEASGSYVDPNVVGLTLAQDAGDDNDLVICYSTRRGDGRIQENIVAEAIDIEVTSESNTTPGLKLLGELAQGNRLASDWPKGSGASRNVTATSASASLVTNGDFELETTAGVPDGWVISTGTPDKTVAISDPEQQTIVISGTPTAGQYSLRWENADGVVRTTATLAHNATSADVQTALQALPGLASVTVSSTGTSPNYTHTVTFTGTAGELNQLTSINNLTGGTITHATTVDGDDGAYSGRALQLISDGSGEQTTVYTPLSGLAVETVYFCHFWIKRYTPVETSSSSSSSSPSQSSDSSTNSSFSTESTSSTEAADSASSLSTSSVSESSLSSSTEAEETSQSTSSSTSSTEASATSASSSSASSSSSATGHELRVEIVDSVGGPATTDAEGYDNALRIDLDHLGDDHVSQWFSFRLQSGTVSPVYLRIRILEQLANRERVYIDEVAVAAGVELYRGGPYLAAFSGISPPILGDGWTLTSTNSRAGSFQEWYNRLYGMAEKGLLLPSAGTVNVPDSLIG